MRLLMQVSKGHGRCGRWGGGLLRGEDVEGIEHLLNPLDWQQQQQMWKTDVPGICDRDNLSCNAAKHRMRFDSTPQTKIHSLFRPNVFGYLSP